MVKELNPRVNWCAREGCFEPPAWRPVLLFFAAESFGDHPPARGEVGIGICEACKDRTQLIWERLNVGQT